LAIESGGVTIVAMSAPELLDESPPAVPTEPRRSAVKPAKKPRRWRRRLLIAAAVMVGLLAAGWIAAHNGYGPAIANAMRAVFGNEFVAWLEDTAYGVEDWVNTKTKADEAPAAPWDVPDTAVSAPPPDPSAVPTGPPPFTLANVGPMHDNVATKGDGVWLPLTDPRKPDDRVRLLKMFVHPDKNRSWSVVVIVAADLSIVKLNPMAGRREPESRTKESKTYERKALVPAEHVDALLAAFNGGYMTTHGDYGMKIDGVVLVPPRTLCCVFAEMGDGSLHIGSWENIRDREPEMKWWRQAPICMYEDGKPHPALDMPKMGWGASSVSGTTVIRRSAVGLDESGKLLFVGIGDHVTAKAMAQAMHHAGARDVAQLDVNFSYPKFVTYEEPEPGKLRAIPLTKEFEFVEDEYVGTKSQRDFFYLTRRAD
jgi:hypothetical protein